MLFPELSIHGIRDSYDNPVPTSLCFDHGGPAQVICKSTSCTAPLLPVSWTLNGGAAPGTGKFDQ